jgi:hypothetical protein
MDSTLVEFSKFGGIPARDGIVEGQKFLRPLIFFRPLGKLEPQNFTEQSYTSWPTKISPEAHARWCNCRRRGFRKLFVRTHFLAIGLMKWIHFLQDSRYSPVLSIGVKIRGFIVSIQFCKFLKMSETKHFCRF